MESGARSSALSSERRGAKTAPSAKTALVREMGALVRELKQLTLTLTLSLTLTLPLPLTLTPAGLGHL